MKKRLLITSIVMMLVVAVALSTATYAWFTSNASVTASTVTMTAATNDEGALGIGWTTDALGVSITGSFAPEDDLLPMAPTTYTVESTTAATIAFNTATIKSVGGTMQFGADGSSATPYTWNDGSGHNSFHVKNLATAGSVTVKVTATLGDTAADLARVAIFKDGTLLGVIANRVAASGTTQVSGVKYYDGITSDTFVTGDGTSAIPAGSYVDAKVAVGTIHSGDAVASFGTQNAVISVSYTLNANTDSEIVVKTWLDGALFDETRSTESATVALSFAAARN